MATLQLRELLDFRRQSRPKNNSDNFRLLSGEIAVTVTPSQFSSALKAATTSDSPSGKKQSTQLLIFLWGSKSRRGVTFLRKAHPEAVGQLYQTLHFLRRSILRIAVKTPEPL